VAQGAPTAFFSYSRDDSGFVVRLAGDLKAVGANVWLDQLDIIPGQRWDRAIEDAMKNCPRLIVILSPTSVESTNVMDEVSFALEKHKTVIPVLYKDCEIPFRLRRLQYVDFRRDYAHGLKELLKVLAPQQEPEPSTPALPNVRDQIRTDIPEMKPPQTEAEKARSESGSPVEGVDAADFPVLRATLARILPPTAFLSSKPSFNPNDPVGPTQKQNVGLRTSESLVKLTVRGTYSNERLQSAQPWREIGYCRFRRDFEVAADPVFDLVVENTSGGSLLLLKTGIRILQRKPGTGGVMGYAQPIKVQAEYSVRCYEEWKRFNLNDKEVWKSFEDPMGMKKDDSPFRFTLCLENFCDTDNASSSEIRFCLQTSSGTVESESIWLEQ
jgi:hypothetical protein